MTQEQIELMISDLCEKIGAVFAYQQFEEGKEVPTPFLVYFLMPNTVLWADGEPYYSIQNLMIELYTDYQDNVAESKIEEELKQRGIGFKKTYNEIVEERLFEAIYEMEV